MRKIVIMGAGGRDFHDFNVVFREDPAVRVVAFTAAQIPGIDDRAYPSSLAGPLYPAGIDIVPEAELPALVATEGVDEVVLAYSDLSHEEVMHRASIAMAAGADFRLIGPRASMLKSRKPVVAVCAVRTGCGKSQTSRHVARMLSSQGLRVALVRHPMPYGDLERMRVQRFATLADIDAADPTVEEREEYEEPVRAGIVTYAGVDYAAVLRMAEQDADVIVWDGGNNDFPFFEPDVLITVTDPLRPGHEARYHPGELNLRMADIVLINKVDAADDSAVESVAESIASLNPTATVVRAASPVTIDGEPLDGMSVLVIEDGPTLTHGGMPFGAGTVAALQAGAARLVDPRPYAVGTIAETFARFPHVGHVLPAMGYDARQLRELEETIARTPCDAVVLGTPADLRRVLAIKQPVRRASYALREIGEPTLSTVLAPLVRQWQFQAA